MKITNEFTVHTPIARAWQVLTDLEGIAPCMPGAALTGVDGDVYQGKVKIKVGPVISEFAGTARFTEKDEAGYRAVIDAKGRDARSAGNASALVTAVLTPAGESTSVSVDTDLKISGKLAQFGSGMIKEVSGKLLAQFVANLEAKLAADQADASPTEPAAALTAEADGTESPAAGSPAAANGVATAADTGISPAAPVAPLSATATQPAAAAPDSGLDSIGDVPATVTDAPATPASYPAVAATAANGSVASRNGRAASASVAAEPAGSASVAAEMAGSASVAAEPAGSASAAVDSAAAKAPFVAAEPEALDLMQLAGGSIYKRLIPVVVGVVAVGAVIAWLIARR
jgi:carbon monoxide dehydrogenase subunit G